MTRAANTTNAGELTRRVTFQQRGLDANSDRLGPLAPAVTRSARIQPLKGSEAVQASRMAGLQPVIITIYRDSLTKLIDDSYEAVDARDSSIAWDITSAIITEDLAWVEILAVQRKGEPT